jgi:bifunctional non-homologous end joining protein LigD
MSLEAYKKKRTLSNTPEPTGGKSKNDELVFVIQKHQASHLHYDFRLELRGVLKSWAVPKGPSLNPKDRRLAQLVEDHPFDYKDFEGIIPEGNYGAGTVIIWDQGSFAPVDSTGDKEQDEKLLLKQFWGGAMKIVLHGKKVKGVFTLVKTPGRGERAWLLTKLKDEEAKDNIDITGRDQSVVSGMTIEEMQEYSGAGVWQSNRSASKTKSKKTKAKKEKEASIIIEAPSKKNYQQILRFIHRDFKGHPTSQMPKDIEPMEAIQIEEAFTDEAFQFEIKWDGYRCLAYSNNGEILLRSKNNKPFNRKYPLLVDTLKEWGVNAVLDGEVTVLNGEGKADFSALQNYEKHQKGNLFFQVFDLLWLDGISLVNEPLTRRQELLKKIIPENTIIRFNDHIDGEGEAFFELIKKNGLEGMVCKRKSSRYLPDDRSSDWQKLPVEIIREYVIVGWTESEAGNPFSRLLFGNYHDDGKLYHLHHSGSSISQELMKSTFAKLKKLEVNKKPFVNEEPDEDTPIHYVKPELVGSFKQKALNLTRHGKIRHPVVFRGLREDVDPKEVVEGKELRAGKLKAEGRKAVKEVDPLEVWKTLHPSTEIEKTEDLEVEGKTITLINYEQDYWQGITKLQLIVYYQSMAPYLLPYLKDRPLGLNVINKWAGEPDAHFMRNMQGNYPSWVEIFKTDRRIPVEGKSGEIDWVLCNDLASLLYLLNLGAVDFHPWAARVEHYGEPDYIVIDLDPEDTIQKDKKAGARQFKKVIDVALAAKEYFDEKGLRCFVKTSGKTGMHLLLPCKGIGYGDTRTIAETICNEIAHKIPALATTETSVHLRGGKVYVDPSQNDYGDRLVAPYCVRAYKQPYVSAPLLWEEVNERLDRNAFTIKTMKERLEQVGDVFSGLMDEKTRKENTRILKSFLGASVR